MFCSFFVITVLTVQSQTGRSLTLPKSANRIITAIKEQCPDCLTEGFVPAGTNKIGFGQHFYPHFFMGDPKVGILINRIPTKAAYKDFLRQPDYGNLKETLAGLFSKARLVVITKEAYAAYITSPPEAITVTLTAALHKCLSSSDRPLCCCCTNSCENECCEKRLGSTFVVMRWPDPLKLGHMIEYHYFPHLGDSKLMRFDETGRKTEHRWCLDSDGPGLLR